MINTFPSKLIVVPLLSLQACNPQLISLKGYYPLTSTEITFTSPADSVWSHLSTLFSNYGMPIKKIEKDKGLITTTNTSFISIYTFEDDKGQLVQPDAWIVLPKAISNKKEWKPQEIYSQWQVQITETEKSTTLQINPLVMCTYFPNKFTSVEIRGQSTGKMEELLKH